MPYARPTLDQLIAAAAADIKSALPGADPLLRRAVLTVLGRVLAGQHHEQFGFLDWLAKNCVPFTSTGEFLEAWAALRGVTRNPAIYAALTVQSTGNTPGASVTAPATLSRSDGTLYTASVGATADATGTIALNLTAQVAGSAGNMANGAALTLQAPASGINSSFTVTATVTNGVDLETDDSLLARTLIAYQKPPQGGDLDDYVAWALSVPGVTRAWCADSLAGSGTVTLYFMMDVVRSYQYGVPLGSNGVSQNEKRAAAASGDQLIVADTIYPKRGATALVYACAPVANPLNLTLSEVPNDTVIRGAIASAIAGLCVRKASPGGAWLSAQRTHGGILRMSDIEAAIDAVPNLDHFVITSPPPSADIVSATGLIATPGTILYL